MSLLLRISLYLSGRGRNSSLIYSCTSLCPLYIRTAIENNLYNLTIPFKYKWEKHKVPSIHTKFRFKITVRNQRKQEIFLLWLIFGPRRRGRLLEKRRLLSLSKRGSMCWSPFRRWEKWRNTMDVWKLRRKRRRGKRNCFRGSCTKVPGMATELFMGAREN